MVKGGHPVLPIISTAKKADKCPLFRIQLESLQCTNLINNYSKELITFSKSRKIPGTFKVH